MSEFPKSEDIRGIASYAHHVTEPAAEECENVAVRLDVQPDGSWWIVAYDADIPFKDQTKWWYSSINTNTEVSTNEPR